MQNSLAFDEGQQPRVQGVPDPQLSYVSFSNNKPHLDFHMQVCFFEMKDVARIKMC